MKRSLGVTLAAHTASIMPPNLGPWARFVPYHYTVPGYRCRAEPSGKSLNAVNW